MTHTEQNRLHGDDGGGDGDDDVPEAVKSKWLLIEVQALIQLFYSCKIENEQVLECPL